LIPAPKAVPNVGKAQYDFLFGKNFQNGIFFRKFSILKKTNHRKLTKNWFFAKGVATCISMGYNFKSSLKTCHQLS